MKIALVAAMANNRVIGKAMKMPWHLPAELQHFKKITLGKPIVMGRATFESIGRPLPGRRNIIISRTPRPEQNVTQATTDVVWVTDPQAAIAAAGDVDELMVIGGGKIYEIFLPLADRLYLTKIDLDVSGDTYFPDYAKAAEWQEIFSEYHPPSERNSEGFTTLIFDRKC